MWDPMYPLYGYVLCWNSQELFVRKSYHLHFRLSTLAHKKLKDFINISLCATLVSQAFLPHLYISMEISFTNGKDSL
jgi:hypothetical protein